MLWEGNTQGELDAMTYKLLTAYPSARECIRAIDARARAEQKMDSKLNVKAIFKRTASTELWVETPAGHTCPLSKPPSRSPHRLWSSTKATNAPRTPKNP
jgi:hypothetical protein